MSVFGLFEAKNRLSELVARAGAGEEVVITKHGRPAARLVPMDQPDDAEVRRKRIEASLERIRLMREEMDHRLSIDEILEARTRGAARLAMIVLDASVALSALIGDDATAIAQVIIARVAQEGGIAPGHWSIEVSSVLAREVRRGRLSPDQAIARASEAQLWGILSDHETASLAFNLTLELALTHRLSVYDAAYLELCLRFQAPLATFDRALAQAAAARGVQLVAAA